MTSVDFVYGFHVFLNDHVKENNFKEEMQAHDRAISEWCALPKEEQDEYNNYAQAHMIDQTFGFDVFWMKFKSRMFLKTPKQRKQALLQSALQSWSQMTDSTKQGYNERAERMTRDEKEQVKATCSFS